MQFLILFKANSHCNLTSQFRSLLACIVKYRINVGIVTKCLARSSVAKKKNYSQYIDNASLEDNKDSKFNKYSNYKCLYGW